MLPKIAREIAPGGATDEELVLAGARLMDIVAWVVAIVVIGGVIAYTLRRKRRAHE
jgi:hypothetical protein